MIKITILFLLSVKLELVELNSNFRITKGLIFEGQKYDSEQFPYVVTIQMHNAQNNSQEICTGSLVFRGSSKTNKVFRNVHELHIHKNYNPESEIVVADLCILKLDEPFPHFTEYVRIGGKPKEFDKNKALDCTCIGFGMVNAEGELGEIGYMMKTKVRHGEKACVLFESVDLKNAWHQYLCSTPFDASMACKGDDGGPMICNGKLYGICSFFLSSINTTIGCGISGTENVHMFVNYYLDWIKLLIEPGYKPKKKKKQPNNSGNMLKLHNALYTILAMLLYRVLTICFN